MQNEIQTQGQMAYIAIPGESQIYRRQIDATDQATDALVHELYGLTQQEIAIVENRERLEAPTPPS